MDQKLSERKIEHIEMLLSDHAADRGRGYFDAVVLKHHALPELDLSDVDPSTVFLGKPLKFPFIISSMTGGADERLITINRNLACAAEAAGVALAVGSQRVMFSEPVARRSFELREFAPHTVICANVGAVQLNYGFGVDECRAAVEILDADALILHLNPLQESCQVGGDTDFRGLAEKIGSVVAALAVPVIVKEVGAGICDKDVEQLLANGVEYVDLAGAGGVSWSRVEEGRARGESRETPFDDWGIPTPSALKMMRPYRDKVTLIASGGVRNGVDMAKAIVLGASLCGMARPLLEPALESATAARIVVERVKSELRKAMFLLGCSTIPEMHGREDLIV